jgi:hypothetical protein
MSKKIDNNVNLDEPASQPDIYTGISDTKLRALKKAYETSFGEQSDKSESLIADMRKELSGKRGLFKSVMAMNNLKLAELAKGAGEHLEMRKIVKKVEQLKAVVEAADSSTDSGDLRTKLSVLEGFGEVYDMDNLDLADFIEDAKQELANLTQSEPEVSTPSRKEADVFPGVNRPVSLVFEPERPAALTFGADVKTDEDSKEKKELNQKESEELIEFEGGDRVKIKRTNGDIEDDWRVADVKIDNKNRFLYTVIKQNKVGQILYKTVTYDELVEWQDLDLPSKKEVQVFNRSEKVKITGDKNEEVWTVISGPNSDGEYAVVIDDSNNEFGLRGKNVPADELELVKISDGVKSSTVDWGIDPNHISQKPVVMEGHLNWTGPIERSDTSADKAETMMAKQYRKLPRILWQRVHNYLYKQYNQIGEDIAGLSGDLPGIMLDDVKKMEKRNEIFYGAVASLAALAVAYVVRYGVSAHQESGGSGIGYDTNSSSPISAHSPEMPKGSPMPAGADHSGATKTLHNQLIHAHGDYTWSRFAEVFGQDHASDRLLGAVDEARQAGVKIIEHGPRNSTGYWLEVVENGKHYSDTKTVTDVLSRFV